MTTYKQYIGLFFAVLLMDQQRPVQSGRAEEKLVETNNMLSELTKKFIEHVRIVFYDGQQAAEGSENWPWLAVSTLVARIGANMYAIQSRALFIAQDIIATYFVAKTVPLPDILMESKYLIDMIASCLINHSIDNGLRALEWERKKIYLLLRVYEDKPGVRDLAVHYFRYMDNLKAKKDEAEQAFEDAFNSYKYDSPLVLFIEHETATLEAIDQLIKDAVLFSNGLEGVENPEGMSQEDLLNRYVNPTIIEDISKCEAMIKDKGLVNFEDHEIYAQDLDGAQVYEKRILREAGSLNSFLMDLDMQMNQLDLNFHQASEELFYRPQRIAEEQSDHPLMAVSTQVAEIEALLYADERRMLSIIRSIIQQNTNVFTYIYAISRRPIDLMIKLLVKYAIEYGLKSIEWRRKKVYLVSKRYLGYTMVEMMRNFYSRIQYKKEQVERAGAEIQQLTDVLQNEASAATVELTKKTIQEYINAAVEQWRADSDDPRLLRKYLEPTMLAAIKATKNRTYNRVHRAENRFVAAITLREMENYENELLAKQLPDRAASS